MPVLLVLESGATKVSDATQHLGIALFKFYHLKKNLPDDGTHSIRSSFQCMNICEKSLKII